MQLGFVSAILGDQSLEQVLQFAEEAAFDCVEWMCWPPARAERRYAGVTHLDCSPAGEDQLERIRRRFADSPVAVSGLGYYPNPLAPDPHEAQAAITHLQYVMRTAHRLGIGVVNTFVGRDWTRSIDAQWPRFIETWQPLVRLAEELGIRLGIENCPMLFSADEWPAGKNLAVSPAIWRRMFREIPSAAWGLNYDPSHLVWQHIDYVQPLWDFADRLVHVHAKDVRIDRQRLNEVGILALPPEYHTPKLPGLGDIKWGRFCSVLTDLAYRGAICVEVEDRAFEGALDRRQASLRQSLRYLRNFVGA